MVELTTATPLAVDTYRRDRITGSFVLVDEVTNATVAAGMVGAPPLAEHPDRRLESRPDGRRGPRTRSCSRVEGRPCLVVGGGAVAAR